MGSFHPFIFVRWINCFLYGIQSVDLSSRDSNLLLLLIAIFLKSYNIFQKSRLLIWPQWTQMLGIYMKIRKVNILAYLIGELLFGIYFLNVLSWIYKVLYSLKRNFRSIISWESLLWLGHSYFWKLLFKRRKMCVYEVSLH